MELRHFVNFVDSHFLLRLMERKPSKNMQRGEKHKSKMPPMNQSIIKTSVVVTPDNSEVSLVKETSSIEKVSQTSIDGFVLNEATTDAEIMWALDVVLSN